MIAQHITADRAQNAPFLGLVLGTGSAALLWSVIVSLVWTAIR